MRPRARHEQMGSMLEGRGLRPGRSARLMARSVILKRGAPHHLSQKVSAGDDLLRQGIFTQRVRRRRVLGRVHRFLRGN
jgi:hypothetical protein